MKRTHMRQTHKEALALAHEFIKKFVKDEYIIAGSIRRKEATIGDVDIVTGDKLCDIEECMLADIHVQKVRGGEKKLDVDYKGVRFNIYFAMPFYWGAMLFFLTGPASYSIAYRRMAKKKGWHLDQYGLKDEYGDVMASRTEASIYKVFGKKYKEPELRGK